MDLMMGKAKMNGSPQSIVRYTRPKFSKSLCQEAIIVCLQDDDMMIYLLTAIGLPPGGCSTVHI
jgi:hypothetical protein